MPTVPTGALIGAAALALALAIAPGTGAAQNYETATVPARRLETGEPPARMSADALDRLIARISSESDSVLAAARSGGLGGLRRSVEECWSASAGYGIEALDPCVVRERAALALMARLEAQVGRLGEAALTREAAERRIAEAYAARGAAPNDVSATPLLVYAVGRRAEPRWADAPSLREMAEAARRAARSRAKDGGEALSREAMACWVDLVLSASRDREEAWECRIADWIAEDGAAADGRTAIDAQRRDFLFFERARADRAAAVRAGAALRWMRAALEGEAG